MAMKGIFILHKLITGLLRSTAFIMVLKYCNTSSTIVLYRCKFINRNLMKFLDASRRHHKRAYSGPAGYQLWISKTTQIIFLGWA